MSDPIKLIITKIGLEQALNADLNGISIKLDKIKFSTDNFESVSGDPRTTLDNVVHESNIAAGGTSIDQNTLRLFTVVDSPEAYSIGSLGIFTEDGTLFAVASVATGQLMKIMPRISFIMSFGMTLTAMLLDNITVVIDQETALAAAMLFQHENHPDPHPQYSALINNLASNLTNLDEELESFIYQYNSQYPKQIMAGVSSGGWATIDVSSKIADMRDNRYSILLTPEGGHEAWSITRNEKSFSYSVFDRSGTARVGYGGQVSWAVVQNSANYQIGGNGEYTIAGTYHIPVLAGETKVITLIGGGGGGGGSRYSGGSGYEANNGKDGQTTSITKGLSVIASALGGKGGTVGVWGNGSSFNNGQGGKGGNITHSASADNILINSIVNIDGLATRDNRAGGVASPFGGAGGNGQYGIGDEGWSFGGGGGSGGLIEFSYKNTSNSMVILILELGAGGIQPVGAGSVGENGKTGYAKIQTLAGDVTESEFTEAGLYQVKVAAGSTMKFDLVGAGAGGGCAVTKALSGDANANGKDGQATSITVNGVVIASANNGKGGKLGWYYKPFVAVEVVAGAAGEGGTTISTNAVTVLESKDGNKGTSVQYNYVGGSSVSPVLTYGKGGAGVAGHGANQEGWSGGGGSGAYMSLTYHNASNSEVSVTLKVGAGGAGGAVSGYASGKAGSDGYARVTKV